MHPIHPNPRSGVRAAACVLAGLLLCAAASAQTTAAQRPGPRASEPKPPAGTPSTPPSGNPNPSGQPGPTATGGTAGAGGLAPKARALADLEIRPAYPETGANGSPGTRYCAPMGVAGQQREAAFRIVNKGAADSGSFRYDFHFVKYGTSAPVSAIVPNLAPGQSRLVTVPIPNGVWENGAVHFTMHADAGKEVAEADEFNNDRSGRCNQPSAS